MVSSFFIWAAALTYVWLILSTVLVIVLENRQPSKTIAWIIVLIGLPVLGLVFFYFFGQDERRRHKMNRHGYQRIRERMLQAATPDAEFHADDPCFPLVKLLEQHQRAKLWDNNQVRLLSSGRSFLHSLLRDIYEAKEHIHIEMYIIENDPVGRLVRDALTDKAREGVEVRLIYDDVGCWNVPNAFFSEMEAAGVLVGGFLPVRFPRLTRRVNYRDHHKICIIDSRIGYIGGMNLALRYAPKNAESWRDLMVRTSGEAALGLQRIFLSNWYFATGRLRDESRFFPTLTEKGNCPMQVVASTPISPYPEIMYALTWMALNARQYLYVTTPYFMPTESVLQALRTAALAGVDVRLLLPLKPDAFWLRWANESYFDDVLRSGIKVYLYENGFLHTKSMVMDDRCCTIGSTNMDFRSLENNFEANAFVYNKEIAQELRDLILHDIEQSREVRLDDWQKRAWWRKFLESHTRILSPLL